MIDKLVRDALTLWATIDPIATLALFAAMTGKLTPTQRRKTALKATLYATLILLGAVIIGQIVLSGMGIQLVSMQVAGGIILFLFGLQMLFGKEFGGEFPPGEPGHDIAIFPLALPAIAGSGPITAAIILTDNQLYSFATQCGTVLVMLAILAINCMLMLAAGSIMKVIGKNGSAVLIRVMGIILAALSIELVMDALQQFDWLDVPA